MATEGLDAQMDDIARAAGVGVGTVYRHFPTKDDLIFALAEHRFQRLAEFATEALAEDDPGPAFERFLYRGAELQATDRSLSEVMRDRPDAMQAAAERVGLLELVRELLTRAQAAGAIRAGRRGRGRADADVRARHLDPGMRRAFRHARRRGSGYLTIMVDGLRPGSSSEMPKR